MYPPLAPPCEATQGGDGLSWENAIVFHHLIDYEHSGKSLKRINEDHNQKKKHTYYRKECVI